MDDKKICVTCNQEKLIELFPKYKKRDGTISYKNKCKTCTSLSDKEYRLKTKGINKSVNKNTISTVDILKQPTKTNNETENEERNTLMSNVLSYDEIKILKDMIKYYPLLKNIDKNKIILEKSNNKKSVRTVNLEDSIYSILKSKSDETNLSISDIVNTLLKKAIEYI